jgi:4-hydroxy-tetrahydrodipicolinate synthase
MTDFQGIFAAAITPLNSDYSPDLDSIPEYLDFLAKRGCQGALLLGTTGEGPSFSPDQRAAVFKSALQIRKVWPEFKLLAGTGTPSLDETIKLNRSAFDIGMDGVVVLPPYYFRDAPETGLLEWFLTVIKHSIPEGGKFFVYNIPGLSGVSISTGLLTQLLDRAPTKFSGLKDSSGDPEFADQLGNDFGSDLMVFTGSDRLLSKALRNNAVGCITAMANLISPQLNDLWQAYLSKEPMDTIQSRIDRIRSIAEKFQPFPPLIKFLLNQTFDFPYWPVCPPLESLSPSSASDISGMINLD